MRGLNNLPGFASSSDGWQRHQQQCIDLARENYAIDNAVDQELCSQSLFPGSQLINQIVVYSGSWARVPEEFSLITGSLDPLYESLSIGSKLVTRSEIVLDITALKADVKQQLVDRVSELLQRNKALSSLVLLDHRQLSALTELFSDLPLQIRCINPNWCRTAELLTIYRNAGHCIFVDSMRVVDAVCCGYSSTVIASEDFVSALTTNALWVALGKSAQCRVIAATSIPQSQDGSDALIVDNRLIDFQRAISLDQSLADDDWLNEYRSDAALNQPVIYPMVGRFQKPYEEFADYRIALRRKIRKLREDPQRFCYDSKNRVLKNLGRFLSTRHTDGSSTTDSSKKAA